MKHTLFAMDKKGQFKEWSISTEGEEIHVAHGKLGGKQQHKVFIAKPKNVGRANATTAEQQAVLEMASRIKKQGDKGYRTTQEDAVTAAADNRTPMLASDYTKVGHSIKYPCSVSPKLDGVRCIARVKDGEVTFTSRGGKEYPVSDKLKSELLIFSGSTGCTEFDGELYIHGVSLQNIVSAVKKPNDLTPDLSFWIFDVPSDLIWEEREKVIYNLWEESLVCMETPHICVVGNQRVEREESARKIMDKMIEIGFEGLMLRNLTGKYEWNNRSRDLQKWKDFQDVEAKVESFEEDALGEAVYWLRLQNGKLFKAKPRGHHKERTVKNADSYLGNWVTVRFQQYTDGGIPQFPVIVGFRECDAQGNPLV